MSESKIRELEWFDLETRLREIIYQQLEIFNKKAREDREAHSLLSTNVSGLEKRLFLLENCVFGEVEGNNVLADLKKKISDVEGSRKKDMVRFDQEIVGFKEKFKTVDFQMKGNTELIKRAEGVQDELSKDIQSVKTILEDHQALILSEIEKINIHFKELNNNYLDKGLKLEEKMNATSAKLDDISLVLLKYDREFENMKKNLNEIFISINLIKTNKLEYELFESERVKNEARVLEIITKCQTFENNFAMRDSFVDKFIPLQTTILLSDTLHSCLDPFSKKRLAEYENLVLKELHRSALDVGTIKTREEAIGTILNDVRHIEQRKTDILIEKPKETVNVTRPIENKKPNSVSPAKVSVSDKYHESYIRKEELASMFDKYCEQKLDPTINKTRFELIEKYENLKKTINTTENECMLYTQQVLREVEDLKNKEIKDISEIETFYSQLKDENDIIKASINEFSIIIGSTSQMIVCLVENAQIDLALATQEDDIRQENYDSLASKNRLQEPLSKKCMSFVSGNTLLPLRNQPKPPASLLYRTRKFQRNELIEMKGKMLKICWDSVSRIIP